MTRARLAVSAAIFALMTVAASAQGYPSYESCGYGGPLGVGPNFHSNNSGSSERAAPRRVYREPQHEAPAHHKRSTAKADDDADKSQDKAKAQAKAQDKAQDKDAAENENSAIARGAVAKADTASDAKADTTTGVQNENSTLTRASLDKSNSGQKSTDAGTSKTASDPKTTQNVGCKKYFPAAGMTLSVPCE